MYVLYWVVIGPVHAVPPVHAVAPEALADHISPHPSIGDQGLKVRYHDPVLYPYTVQEVGQRGLLGRGHMDVKVSGNPNFRPQVKIILFQCLEQQVRLG